MSASLGDHAWGVDSYTPVYRPGHKSLYDSVAAVRKPDFWGRYIKCPNQSDRNVLTKDEKDHLFGKDCAILPVYNRTVYQHKGGSHRGTFLEGLQDGWDAIETANALDISSSVWIYADIEPSWSGVTASWVLGWWTAFYASQYWGGLYCTLNRPYNDALAMAQALTPPIALTATELLHWKPLRSIESFAWVWAVLPHRGSFKTPPAWAPHSPAGHADRVQVWQHTVQKLVGGAYVDGDLATIDGYYGMWRRSRGTYQAHSL